MNQSPKPQLEQESKSNERDYVSSRQRSRINISDLQTRREERLSSRKKMSSSQSIKSLEASLEKDNTKNKNCKITASTNQLENMKNTACFDSPIRKSTKNLDC